MRTSSKILLVAAVAVWVLSYTDLDTLLYGIFKPVAAILVIVAFIANFFPDREYEQFDEDHRLRDELLEGRSLEEAHDSSSPPGTRFEHAR